ncbi:hypothetical protein BX600DRAFT_431551 [Xylariales sp. PMI_506]|nr:hypothetical protein BX600DRAFT_431551 [Xylariales sp. PMI_506]
MRLIHLSLLVASLFASICAADLTQYINQIPTCGLTCLAKTIPASECKSFTNSTCICASASLQAATEECLSEACSVLERLEVAKIDEQACDKTVEYRRPSDWIGMGLLDALGPICFALRLWSRYVMTKKMEADDWIMAATFIVWIPFTVLGVILRIEAIGYNIWDLSEETITRALKIFFIDEILYTLVLGLLRVSILFFYMRVFAPLKQWCWATIILVVLSATVVILMTLFQCTPIRYNWDGWTGEFDEAYQCAINVNVLSYAAAASGILQDLIILILPLPVIATLQMQLRKKIMTLGIFSLGIFIIITSCIRLKSLVQFAKSLNPTWDYAEAVLWTSLEVNISVAVVCLPAIRVFLAKKLPNVFGSFVTRATKKSMVSSTSQSAARRKHQYADLPDRSASQGPSSSITWDQNSIELEGKLGPTITTTVGDSDEGDTSLIAIPTSFLTLDEEIQRPKRVSMSSFLTRKKVGSSQV